MPRPSRPAPLSVKLAAYGGFMARDAGGNEKGVARIRLNSGAVCMAELHWYEATGIGKREFKIKRFIEDR